MLCLLTMKWMKRNDEVIFHATLMNPLVLTRNQNSIANKHLQVFWALLKQILFWVEFPSGLKTHRDGQFIRSFESTHILFKSVTICFLLEELDGYSFLDQVSIQTTV